MRSSFLCADDIRLAVRDEGTGIPVVFQHGLGGDDSQVADVFPDIPAVRRITLECRGQGGSAYGPAADLSIPTFANDLAALLDHLGVQSAIVGGISMGAAIALRSAIVWPRRVRALILARPAWISEAAPPNMFPYYTVGDLLLRYPPEEARQRFLDSPTASLLESEAPDNFASLLGFFGRPDPKSFGALLRAIAADGPGISEEEIARIDVPTLVIGHSRDLAHPLGYAQRLASLIPEAELGTITPKARDREAYRRQFRENLADFLDRWT
jgi:pimeloyl-ACP methyl ester carboxylesterase